MQALDDSDCRRLMRRERFADEAAADVESTQASSQDSVFSHGESQHSENVFVYI